MEKKKNKAASICSRSITKKKTTHVIPPYRLAFSWEIPLEAFPVGPKVQMGQTNLRFQTILVLSSAFHSYFYVPDKSGSAIL